MDSGDRVWQPRGDGFVCTDRRTGAKIGEVRRDPDDPKRWRWAVTRYDSIFEGVTSRASAATRATSRRISSAAGPPTWCVRARWTRPRWHGRSAARPAHREVHLRRPALLRPLGRDRKAGHFECKKCGKKYGFSEEEWTPFKKQDR